MRREIDETVHHDNSLELEESETISATRDNIEGGEMGGLYQKSLVKGTLSILHCLFVGTLADGDSFNVAQITAVRKQWYKVEEGKCKSANSKSRHSLQSCNCFM